MSGTFFFFGAWSFVMTVWGITYIHETSGIILEHMNEVFGVSTWKEYMHYMWINTEYFFYFGGNTMYEFTHGDKAPVPYESGKDHALTNEQKRSRSPTVLEEIGE